MKIRLLVAACAVAAAACHAARPEPVGISGSDPCRNCRMTVSDVHFAAQVAARGEEPIFFDDIGCLAGWLADAQPPTGAVVFVADHRSGRWVVAQHAVYTRVTTLSTPMNSGILAYEDAVSRDLDPAARGGTPLGIERVFTNRLPAYADAH